MTTRSILGGAALVLAGIVLGVVAGKSEPALSNEPSQMNIVPGARIINPLGRYRMVSSNNQLYMNDTETGEVWVLSLNQRWHRLADGPKLASAPRTTTTEKERTVETKGE